MVDLAFVLPVHNVDKILVPRVTCLLELLAELQVTFEVVIVDDGSIDETLHEANELAFRFKQIRVIHRAMRYGRDSAVQLALQGITAPYVMILGDISRRVTTEFRRLWEARHRRYDGPQSLLQGMKGPRGEPDLEIVRPELVTCGRVILLRRDRGGGIESHAARVHNSGRIPAPLGTRSSESWIAPPSLNPEP